jgi:putative spermidine/putrescine transport system ATP-binding protein
VRERFFLGSQWMYALSTPIGELMVLSPNDGREAIEEGGRRCRLARPLRRVLPAERDTAEPAMVPA